MKNRKTCFGCKHYNEVELYAREGKAVVCRCGVSGEWVPASPEGTCGKFEANRK